MPSDNLADNLKAAGYPQAVFATSPEGKMGLVPADHADAAQQSGFVIHEPAVYMTSPEGKLGLVPRSHAKAALDKGFQVGQPTGNLTPDTSNQSLVLSAADKLGMTTPPSFPTMRKPSPPIAPSAQDLANQALASNPKSAHIGVAPAASPNIAPAYVSHKTGETLPPDQMDKYSRPIDADLHPLDAVAQGFGTMLHPVSAFGEDIANDARARSNSTDPSLSEHPGIASLDKNVISPIQEAGGEFVGGFGDPKQAALLAALGGVPALGPAGRLIGYGAGAAMLPDMVGGAAQKVTNAGLANDEGNTREAVKNLAGAGLDTYFASDIGKGVVEGTPQAFRDAKSIGQKAIDAIPADAIRDGRSAIADKLRASAEEQYQRFINPTTNRNKNITSRVVPELLDRGVVSTSPGNLAKRASANKEVAGRQIDEAWDNLPPGTTIPSKPLADGLEEYKQQFQNKFPISEAEAARLSADKKRPDGVSVSAEPNANGGLDYFKVVDIDSNAVGMIDDMKQMILNHGENVPAEAIRKVRQVLDDTVARAGGYAGVPLADASRVAAMRELAGLARTEISNLDPNLKDANAEFSFWKNVERVASATKQRRVGQMGGLKKLVYGAAGGALGTAAHPGVGTIAGVEAGKALSAFEANPLRNTLFAVAKNKLANAIEPKPRQLQGGTNPPELPPSTPPAPPTPPTGGAPSFLKGKIEHPDVPGGEVVGLDAKSGLPIVKRAENEQGNLRTAENAPQSVLSPSRSEAPDSTKLVQNSQEGATGLAESPKESPDGFVPGTHAAQAAEVLKSEGMKDVRVSIHSDENQALSDEEQIRNNGKTIVSFHVPGIDSTIQRHAEDLDTPEKVQAVRQEVEQRFAGSPNKTVEGIKSKQSAVPVLQKAIEAPKKKSGAKSIPAFLRSGDQPSGLSAHGAGAASVEELNRNREFFRVGKQGQVSTMGVRPDATLQAGEAVVSRHNSTGDFDIQNQNGPIDREKVIASVKKTLDAREAPASKNLIEKVLRKSQNTKNVSRRNSGTEAGLSGASGQGEASVHGSPEGTGAPRDNRANLGTAEAGKLKEKKKYKFGNTQVPIPKDSEAHAAIEEMRSKIADDDLAGDGKGIGGNHITVRYGIKSDDVEGIKKYLSQQSPFDAKLGATKSFPPSEHSNGAAPIVASIVSPELRRIEKELDAHGDFAERSFPDYKPHTTIAYVKAEAAKKYSGMDVGKGKSFRVSSIAISKRDGTTEVVNLGGDGSSASKSTKPTLPRFLRK